MRSPRPYRSPPPVPLEISGARCRTCGHLDSEHRPQLPSPCGVGWHPGLLIDAMESAKAEGECPLRALGEETEAQRRGGACPCIGFSPDIETATSAGR